MRSNVRNLNQIVKPLVRSHSDDRYNSLINRYENSGPSQSQLTVSIKDIFCLENQLNTCASKTLEDFRPTYDSAVVSSLKRSGIKIIGKSNMDEFSMGSSSTLSHFGPVIHPLGGTRTVGGSSGGSAASVSSGLCDLAIGSDTGGSTRLPSTYCGIVGLKPSYGTISRYGMVQYSQSLDCVGLMAKSVKLVHDLYKALVGYDSRDPTSVPVRLVPERSNSTSDLSDLRIGIPVEYFTSELQPKILERIRKTISDLKSRGAQLISVSLPSTDLCLGAYYVIASSEASSNLARYSGVHYGYRDPMDEIVNDPEDPRKSPHRLFVETRSSGFGEEVKRRILLGTYALSASGMENYFLKAQKIRRVVRQEFERCFKTEEEPDRIDLLLTPPTLSIPPRIDRHQTQINSWAQDRLLVPASLAGLPAIVIPIEPIRSDDDDELDQSWPVGVQLIGPWGSEMRLFRVGSAIEEAREARVDQS